MSAGNYNGTRFEPLSFNENQDSDAFFDDDSDGTWEDDTNDLDNLLEHGEVDEDAYGDWNNIKSGRHSDFDISVPISTRSYEKKAAELCTKRNLRIIAIFLIMAIILYPNPITEIEQDPQQLHHSYENYTKTDSSDISVSGNYDDVESKSVSKTTTASSHGNDIRTEGWNHTGAHGDVHDNFGTENNNTMPSSASDDDASDIDHVDDISNGGNFSNLGIDGNNDGVDIVDSSEKDSNDHGDNSNITDTLINIENGDGESFDEELNTTNINLVNPISNSTNSTFVNQTLYNYSNHTIDTKGKNSSGSSDTETDENFDFEEEDVAGSQMDYGAKDSSVDYYGGAYSASNASSNGNTQSTDKLDVINNESDSKTHLKNDNDNYYGGHASLPRQSDGSSDEKDDDSSISLSSSETSSENRTDSPKNQTSSDNSMDDSNNSENRDSIGHADRFSGDDNRSSESSSADEHSINVSADNSNGDDSNSRGKTSIDEMRDSDQYYDSLNVLSGDDNRSSESSSADEHSINISADNSNGDDSNSRGKTSIDEMRDSDQYYDSLNVKNDDSMSLENKNSGTLSTDGDQYDDLLNMKDDENSGSMSLSENTETFNSKNTNTYYYKNDDSSSHSNGDDNSSGGSPQTDEEVYASYNTIADEKDNDSSSSNLMMSSNTSSDNSVDNLNTQSYYVDGDITSNGGTYSDDNYINLSESTTDKESDDIHTFDHQDYNDKKEDGSSSLTSQSHSSSDNSIDNSSTQSYNGGDNNGPGGNNNKDSDSMTPDQACAPSNVIRPRGRNNCEQICKPRSCCFTKNDNCMADNVLWCNEYMACYILYSSSSKHSSGNESLIIDHDHHEPDTDYKVNSSYKSSDERDDSISISLDQTHTGKVHYYNDADESGTGSDSTTNENGNSSFHGELEPDNLFGVIDKGEDGSTNMMGSSKQVNANEDNSSNIDSTFQGELDPDDFFSMINKKEEGDTNLMDSGKNDNGSNIDDTSTFDGKMDPDDFYSGSGKKEDGNGQGELDPDDFFSMINKKEEGDTNLMGSGKNDNGSNIDDTSTFDGKLDPDDFYSGSGKKEDGNGDQVNYSDSNNYNSMSHEYLEPKSSNEMNDDSSSLISISQTGLNGNMNSMNMEEPKTHQYNKVDGTGNDSYDGSNENGKTANGSIVDTEKENSFDDFLSGISGQSTSNGNYNSSSGSSTDNLELDDGSDEYGYESSGVIDNGPPSMKDQQYYKSRSSDGQ